ncbi:hydroxyethylthiazole kinase, partial [Enterococcus faecium]|uniref:hydroxyethylthiazole kinase n=1 Tax=Enterococcus faecium TaxID=1352 RepID=UPI00396D1305
MVERIMRHVRVSVIRGNAGEIATLMGVDWAARGVDAGDGACEPRQLALEAAKRYGCVVAVTGKEDMVSDGHVVMEV